LDLGRSFQAFVGEGKWVGNISVLGKLKGGFGLDFAKHEDESARGKGFGGTCGHVRTRGRGKEEGSIDY
jgi:hypothetical protein